MVRDHGMAAVAEVVGRHPEETVVLVGHTVMNRLLLLSMLGLGHEGFWRLGQDPCAINVVEVQEGQYVIRSLNQTAHLQGDQLHPALE